MIKVPKIMAILTAVGVWIGASIAANAALYIDGILVTDVQPVALLQASNPTDQEVADALGLTLAQLGTLQYKSDFGGSDQGPLAAYYTATYSDTVDPAGVTITWVPGSPQIVDPAQNSYLLVKDGEAGSLIWALYAIPWDGKAPILAENLWPNGHGGYKGISNVAIYGGMAAVPEPTTVIAGALLLIPFGVSTLRFLRRNHKS